MNNAKKAQANRRFLTVSLDTHAQFRELVRELKYRCSRDVWGVEVMACGVELMRANMDTLVEKLREQQPD